MTDAKNIRKWGTSNGLGELAKKGPLENTNSMNMELYEFQKNQ